MQILAYDDLPAGSDVRREYRDDGTLLITVPAGEIPPAVRRSAMQSALVVGTILSSAFLLAALLVFAHFVTQNRISGAPLLWAGAFFIMFCAAMVALVSWVRYRVLIERLETVRQQSTVIAVGRERVVIETTGPFGVAGLDLPRQRIANLELKRSRITDNRGRSWRMWHLNLTLSVSRSIILLPGREPTEIRWIAGAIREVLSLPARESA